MALKSFVAPVQPGVAELGQAQGLRAHVVDSTTSSDGLNRVNEEGMRLAAASVSAAINGSHERLPSWGASFPRMVSLGFRNLATGPGTGRTSRSPSLA